MDWQAVAKAQIHPLRLRLLEAIAASEEPLSPKLLAEQLGEPLGNVAYHARRLEAVGIIYLVRTEPRRGAVEHFYALGPKPQGHRVKRGRR